MADESKIGAPWQDRELDVIVADYFETLSDDLAGKPYIKARHNAAVIAETGRTHRSVTSGKMKFVARIPEHSRPPSSPLPT
jgi:hypothetical protein